MSKRSFFTISVSLMGLPAGGPEVPELTWNLVIFQWPTYLNLTTVNSAADIQERLEMETVV